jgi:elongation factor Ts
MSEISSELVKKLRDTTGVGMMDCKKALLETNGDIESAIVWLRKKGAAGAVKKASREAKEGVIGSYIHAGEKVGVLLEINCETDFVARTDAFRNLVKDITLQIAAASPRFVQREEVPAVEVDREKDVASETVKGKPENVVEKIVAGKLDKFYSTICLVEQPFIKDPNLTMRDLINAKIAELGENIVVRRFSRFQLGENVSA